ncbi:hypothetical protein PIROE2DRAFT_5294 [Piromyces sp. E2]|nr:hypothetical protein PIROE2DRAFT_5294 [Piromyces sp. E2]|eukprot:OUM67323.1 hypothetical protein PIROE2DRAFT_5294 [Piromyces sp. E2]
MGYLNVDKYISKDIQVIISTLLFLLNEKNLYDNEVKEIEQFICYICKYKYNGKVSTYNINVYEKLDKKNTSKIDEINGKYDFLNAKQNIEGVDMKKLTEYLIDGRTLKKQKFNSGIFSKKYKDVNIDKLNKIIGELRESQEREERRIREAEEERIRRIREEEEERKRKEEEERRRKEEERKRREQISKLLKIDCIEYGTINEVLEDIDNSIIFDGELNEHTDYYIQFKNLDLKYYKYLFLYVGECSAEYSVVVKINFKFYNSDNDLPFEYNISFNKDNFNTYKVNVEDILQTEVVNTVNTRVVNTVDTNVGNTVHAKAVLTLASCNLSFLYNFEVCSNAENTGVVRFQSPYDSVVFLVMCPILCAIFNTVNIAKLRNRKGRCITIPISIRDSGVLTP